MGTIDWNAFAIVLMYNAYSSMVRQYMHIHYVLLSWSCQLSVASWAVSLKHRTTHAQFLFIKGEDKQCLNKLIFIFLNDLEIHLRFISGSLRETWPSVNVCGVLWKRNMQYWWSIKASTMSFFLIIPMPSLQKSGA